MHRVINFGAGPSTIALEVLQKAQEELISYQGRGFSIMEISHRTPIFEDVLSSAIRNVKELYGFGDEHAVLFLQGGATLQFAQIPMNLYNGGVAEYVDTGIWTSKAIKEAQIQNINYKVIASSKESKFDHIPKNIHFSDDADYAYICSNNTIYGTQYKELPKCKCPLVVDSSSDLFSRPIDISNIGVFYGGVQKNGGPAGVTLVVIKKELAERVSSSVPTILRYKTQIESNSMSNTPNTFGIYMLNLTLEWVKNQGGLSKIHIENLKKAELLYSCIDESGGFYKAHAKVDSRSLMNVSFNVHDVSLEPIFVKEAEYENMIGLKGHRLLGGIRASIYNAITYENVKVLTEFMREFAKKHG